MACHKRGFTDSREALYQIKRDGFLRDRDRLAPYICNECGVWHIGHSATLSDARKKLKLAMQMAGMGLDWKLLKASKSRKESE